MKKTLIAALVALVCGFAGAALWQVSGLGDRATRNYLVAHPELLEEMARGLQQREGAKRLADVSGDVAQPFSGAVLGNPDGSRVLVEFADYACTYCRQSVADVERLIAADPDLKVVIREWPIFPGSEAFSRMGLAAANQGKFAAFHKAMYEQGAPSAATLDRAMTLAGLDREAALAFAASPQVDAELARNQALAQQLGFSGTPSWIAGGQLLEGAVGGDRLAEAVAAQPAG